MEYTTPLPELTNLPMPRFALGNLVATTGALEAVGHENFMPYVFAHLTGHWGDLDEEDQNTNDWSVENGSRIVSVYHVKGNKFYIITEHDRSATTILLPEEY